jgi:hypothetical protein
MGLCLEESPPKIINPIKNGFSPDYGEARMKRMRIWRVALRIL